MEVLEGAVWEAYHQHGKNIPLRYATPPRDHFSLKINVRHQSFLEMCSKIIAISFYSNGIEIGRALVSKILQMALGIV